MLPKFRPATIGGSNRPQIRPVKPSAPPQPPQKRHSSGIRNPAPESIQPATKVNGAGEPPTMAAARARIHEIARELPSDNRFGGSQQLRYDGETQGRFDDNDLHAAHAAYDRQFAPDSYQQPQQGYQQDAYDALPPLGGVQEDPWPTNDPMTELRPQYDEALNRHEQRYGSDRPYDNHAAHYGGDPLPADDNSGKYERRHEEQAPSTYSSDRYDAAAYEANYPKAQRRDEPPQSDQYRRSEEPRGSYRRDEEERHPSYQPPHAGRADETRAEGTGDRNRSRDNNWSDAPANDPEIPAPARIPQELRVPEGFVMGVQPIRTPSMGAQQFPPPQAVITPGRSMNGAASYNGGAPGTMAATPAAMNQPMGAFGPMTAASMNPLMPVIPQPPAAQMGMSGGMQMQPMMPAMMNQMHVRAHTSVRPGTGFGHQRAMTEVEEAQQGSKVGRFAWFVFGAAFGIFFAFAATGFGGFGKKEEAPVQPQAQTQGFPPPPAPTQQVQQPIVQQPAPMVQQGIPMQQPVAMQPGVPMQQPVAMQPGVPMQQQPVPQVAQQQPVAPVAMQPVAPVAMQPIAAPPTTGVPMGVIAPPQAVAPIQPAPQQQVRPAPQRRSAPRRNTGRSAPVNNSGDDDDSPPPPKKNSGGGDASDILGAGIGG